MFLPGVSEIVIQRIGRWESRVQVKSFTFGVSFKMLENEQFYHLNQV